MNFIPRILQALCLVLFPLSFLLLSNTGLHPGFAGTPAEMIQGLAAEAGRWRLVHAGLAGGSLLGLAVILTLVPPLAAEDSPAREGLILAVWWLAVAATLTTGLLYLLDGRRAAGSGGAPAEVSDEV